MWKAFRFPDVLRWNPRSRRRDSDDIAEMHAFASDARAELRRYVALPGTRSSLTAYARRWGLSDTAEDVVQTVLCDALAVQAVPVPATDIPRWVSGIAKKKIADERRRRARWQWVELEDPTIATSPEATDLLKRIERELVDPEQRRALGWLLREHAGDSLLEIARELAIEPPTLRQRIHRLRSKLRARYLVPLLVLVGVGSAFVWSERAHQQGVAHSLASPLGRYNGRWRVVRAEPSRYASLGLRVVVNDGSATVQGATGLLERALLVEALTETTIAIRSEGRSWRAVLEAPDAAHLRLTGEHGFVELERER
jgi:DNA-directed RNA polymerase specialized sigma24 family protein